MGQIVTSFLILESPGPHSAYKIGYTRKGGEFGGEWMNVYVRLSLFDVYLKLSQHCQLATCVHAKSLQSYLTLCNPMDYSPPGSLSMGFSRQEYWNGLPYPPPGDLPDPGIKPVSPASPARQAYFLPLSHWGSPLLPVTLWISFLLPGLLCESQGTNL